MDTADLTLGDLVREVHEDERRIAAKALARFKIQLRALTKRTQGMSLSQLIEPLARHLVGWRGHFGFCQTTTVLSHLDAWIRRRLRMYLWRQRRYGAKRFAELHRRGVPKFDAAVAAASPTGLWRMSGRPAVRQALRNRYFDSIGLARVAAASNA